MTRDQNGTWEMEKNENFDGYMKALGIDFATRKIAVCLHQTKIIEQDGDNFKTKTNSTFRNYNLDFTVGVEFDEHTKGLDDRHVKSLITWEGDVLVCVQKGERGMSSLRRPHACTTPNLHTLSLSTSTTPLGIQARGGTSKVHASSSCSPTHLPSTLPLPHPIRLQMPSPSTLPVFGVHAPLKGYRSLLLQEALPDSHINRNLSIHERPSTSVPGLTHCVHMDTHVTLHHCLLQAHPASLCMRAMVLSHTGPL